jgi:hypothetical protein
MLILPSVSVGPPKSWVKFSARSKDSSLFDGRKSAVFGGMRKNGLPSVTLDP